MSTREALLDVLARWNPWGRARLRPGRPRAVVARLEPFLDTPEIVALIGPRRAGKTTVMFQIMDSLLRAGESPEALLHVNLEEPALAPELGPELLEQVYRAYRAEVFPRGRAWIFLDEVQQVPGWERWVRARGESEDVKIFITGSSAALMSRELATLLTGRQVTFKVLPLDFREFLDFRQIEAPATPRRAGSPPEIEHALLEYLRWGGYPEVVLAENEERREILLKQYFDDVLFKDVALRHEVRDLTTLRSLGVHLLGQTASLISTKRVASIFGVSADLARSYCAYLEEAFLVAFAEHYSLKTSERLRRPRKVHAVDLGLRNAVGLTGSPDRGRLAESAVFQALAREPNDGLYHWQGDGEVDVAVRRGNSLERAIQVVYGGLDDETRRRRELGALEEARKAFPGVETSLVVVLPENARPGLGSSEVCVIPLWRFLLGER